MGMEMGLLNGGEGMVGRVEGEICMLMTYYRYRSAGGWGCFLKGPRGGRGH